jgi:hypothetical protein
MCNKKYTDNNMQISLKMQLTAQAMVALLLPQFYEIKY